MEIFNYLKERDKIDIFLKTTGRPGNMKKNGTVSFKTVRMVSLSIVLLSENYVPEVMDCAFLRAS
jgi:hypothetical protein